MKYIIWFLPLIIQVQVFGQSCVDDQHSTNVNDSWISCNTSESPNSMRGTSHWVQYDLGAFYQLDGTWFWNYNVSNKTHDGMRNIVIDYSLDGHTWTEAASYTLSQASGQADYTGEMGPALGMITARYILITAIDTYGNDACAGLSEVRFEISGPPSLQQDVMADNTGITLYPNPTAGLFVIDGQLIDYDIMILDATGDIIQDFTGASSQLIIDISNLPTGLYFVSVKNKLDNSITLEKIVKQ